MITVRWNWGKLATEPSALPRLLTVQLDKSTLILAITTGFIESMRFGSVLAARDFGLYATKRLKERLGFADKRLAYTHTPFLSVYDEASNSAAAPLLMEEARNMT